MLGLIVLHGMSLVGCFEAPQPICQYSCAQAPHECPPSYECRADQYCHLVGTTGSCPGFPGPEAGTVADAAMIDGPGIDASGVDGPMIDAPMVDAPMIDAPMIDAPMVDAPMIDAPMIDAPMIDAPMIDAPDIDAPDIDATID
jgi:hypothetical protein